MLLLFQVVFRRGARLGVEWNALARAAVSGNDTPDGRYVAAALRLARPGCATKLTDGKNHAVVGRAFSLTSG